MRTEQLPAKAYGQWLSAVLSGYYRGPDHPFKLRLLRWIESLLGYKRIRIRTRNGAWMAVDQADLIQRELLYTGVYEPELTRLFQQEIAAGDVFHDIGANAGYYACLARQCGARVVAFEPDPLNCEILKFNLAQNPGFAEATTVMPLALGENDARKVFKRAHVTNTGMSGFENERPVASFEVQVRSLDSLKATDNIPLPDIMKVDVEGWELPVFKGASGLLATHKPRLIVFEAECDAAGQVRDPSIHVLLEKSGYRVEHLARLDGPAQERENYVARLAGGAAAKR